MACIDTGPLTGTKELLIEDGQGMHRTVTVCAAGLILFLCSFDSCPPKTKRPIRPLPGPNVRFSQNRSFRRLNFGKIHRLLTASSGHKKTPPKRGVIIFVSVALLQRFRFGHLDIKALCLLLHFWANKLIGWKNQYVCNCRIHQTRNKCTSSLRSLSGPPPR